MATPLAEDSVKPGPSEADWNGERAGKGAQRKPVQAPTRYLSCRHPARPNTITDPSLTRSLEKQSWASTPTIPPSPETTRGFNDTFKIFWGPTSVS